MQFTFVIRLELEQFKIIYPQLCEFRGQSFILIKTILQSTFVLVKAVFMLLKCNNS